MARPIARLKLGYFPLPIEEAQNIRALLLPTAPYAAIDPCVGDGTALIEITKDTGGHLAGIELDADGPQPPPRMASPPSTAVRLSAGYWRKPARSCI